MIFDFRSSKWVSTKRKLIRFDNRLIFYLACSCAKLKNMRVHYFTSVLLSSLLMGIICTACETGEEAFVDDRLHMPCQQAYHICNLPASCVIDKNHYVEGVFPGARRLVVKTERRDVKLDVKLYISTMEAPGTEIIVQASEPDCTLDTVKARDHRVDIDLFEEAGDDRTLGFNLEVADKGEHLLEIYSDASAEYLLLVTQR